MSKDIDKFSSFIEEKLNDFEVPYNESHWSEMSQKLDGLKPAPNVSSGLTKNLLWAGAAAIVAVGTWFLLTKDNSIEKDIQKNENTVAVGVPVSDDKTEILKENTTPEQNIEQPELISKDSDKAELEKEEKVDNKIEKYAEYSEQQKKENSEEFVADFVEDQNSNFDNETEINQELKTDILVLKKAFCVGDEVQFDIDREIDGAKYYWDFGDQDLKSRKPRPTHKFKKPGTYNVILYVAKGEIGDKNDYPAHKTIVIKSIPNVEIDEAAKQITLNDPYAEFEARSNDKCQYDWLFNEARKSKGEKVSFLIENKGYYQVMVTATNEIGCSNTIYHSYNAENGSVLDVETALTPNGDGDNDLFLPKELTISNVDFKFTVRDKHGQIVFQTNDKYDAWNGNINNTGGQLPTDTYSWQLSFTDDRGKVHNQFGKITLLR